MTKMHICIMYIFKSFFIWLVTLAEEKQPRVWRWSPLPAFKERLAVQQVDLGFFLHQTFGQERKYGGQAFRELFGNLAVDLAQTSLAQTLFKHWGAPSSNVAHRKLSLTHVFWRLSQRCQRWKTTVPFCAYTTHERLKTSLLFIWFFDGDEILSCMKYASHILTVQYWWFFWK